MNNLNNLSAPLYVYWLVGFGFFWLGSIHWFFYVLAILVWTASTVQDIKKQ